MELLTALIAPILGGVISFGIWQSKRNSITLHDSMQELHSCVHKIDDKIDDMALDMAKNYCNKDELKYHMDQEADWHDQHHIEVKELRQEMNDRTEKLSHDVAEMKDMQWKIRMDQLEIKGRLDMDSDNC